MVEEGGPGEAPRAIGSCFLSHSSRDAARAREVRAILEGAGMTCWMAPDDIPPGADWPAEIVAAIERSTHLVVLLSRASIRSDHVSREVAYASERGIQVVPLRLGDVQTEGTLRYMLQVVHRVDVFPGRIADHRESILAAVGSSQRPVPHEGPRPAPGGGGRTSPPALGRPRVRADRRALGGIAVAVGGIVIVASVAAVLAPGGGASPTPRSVIGPPSPRAPGPVVARMAWVRSDDASAPIIHVADIDDAGTPIGAVTTVPGDSPTLSPDGRWLVYRAARGDTTELRIVDTVTPQALPEVLRLPEAGADQPAWSPVVDASGGGSLAYRWIDQDQAHRIRVVGLLADDAGIRAETRSCEVAAGSQPFRRQPTWAADGTRLAWAEIEGVIGIAPTPCGGPVRTITIPDIPGGEALVAIDAPTWLGDTIVVTGLGEDATPCLETALSRFAASTDAPLLTPFSVSSAGWPCLASASPSGRVAFVQRDGDIITTQVTGSDQISRTVGRDRLAVTRDTPTEYRPAIVDRAGGAPG